MFPLSSVSSTDSNAHLPPPLIAISPLGSYQTTHGGLELYLERPEGEIRTKNGVNNKIAEGATVNSTFTLLHGRVTFEVKSATVAGVVTAAILIADQKHDEIDIELLGGDPSHWQTNIFAPSPKDDDPLFGVFSSVEDVPHPDPTIAQTQAYTIDWSRDRIQWEVNGRIVRTLKRENTMKGGAMHYPSHPMRVQLGIWDASNPKGTSEWAKGPINWKEAPRSMKSVVRSITVECPH